jgi:formylglycine-generating enzyme required for sulfatase activity
VYLRGLAWRDLLVSNAEFCGVLNALHAAGIPNTQRGTHLLLVPMPHERGGRTHWSPEQETWTVSPGFAHHPVYWVTWLGAAVFAAVNSARLPRHGEVCVLAADTEPSNHDYALGDVAPVAHMIAPHGVHHPVGNVQVWCGDGPMARFDQPVERWIHGAAWNTPATAEEVNRLRSRHLLGASRGIGIRLVRDVSAPFTGPTVAQVATVLDTWIDSLADRRRTLADLDLGIVAALQADVGLRAHV